jgi:hypothetical protein
MGLEEANKMETKYLVAYQFWKEKIWCMSKQYVLKEFSELEQAVKFAREHLGDSPLLMKTDLAIDNIANVKYPDKPYTLLAEKHKWLDGIGDWDTDMIWYEAARYTAGTLEEGVDRLVEKGTHKIYAGVELKLFPELVKLNGGGN